MKARLVSMLTALLAVAWMATGVHAGDGAIRKQVEALFKQVAAGFDTGDVERIVATATPDATLKYLDGETVTMADWKANWEKNRSNIRNMKSAFKVERAEARGDQAMTTYTETHDYVQTGPDQQSHQYRGISRFRATLVKTPEGWRFQRFVQLSRKQFRDGKPVVSPPSRPKR